MFTCIVIFYIISYSILGKIILKYLYVEYSLLSSKMLELSTYNQGRIIYQDYIYIN